MIRITFSPDLSPACLVACRCMLLKHDGTVIAALFTWSSATAVPSKSPHEALSALCQRPRDSVTNSFYRNRHVAKDSGCLQ